MQLTKTTATEIMSIGKAFAESGMFPDIKSAAQAIVKITAGQEIGIPPFAAMSGIHIISGKPTIGAGLMASCVKGSGKYNYKVKEQTEKVCSIEFFEGAESLGTSTLTIEDAKKAGTKNLDKYARNMLFARAMSNGVKWFCPDVFSGPVYVPEEMEQEQPQEPTDAEINDAIKLIGSCVGRNQLDSAWKTIPAHVRAVDSVLGAAKARALHFKLNESVPSEAEGAE